MTPALWLLLAAAPARAARPAAVEAVAVELVVSPARRDFAGFETLSLRAPAAGADAVSLDAAGLTLEGLAPRPGEAGLWSLPAPLSGGATVEVRVGFRGGPEAGLRFAADRVYALGEGEADGRWFPRPEGRPRWSLTAVVPDDWAAVSNGVLVSSGPDAFPGNARWSWSAPVPVPPALAALYAGPYARVALSSAPVPVEAWVPRGREDAARRAFASAPALLARFSAVFGARYPWPRLALAVVPSPRFDGYEFAGAPRFDERVLDGGRDEVVAHELVHQWAGAWLVPASPADAWLAEAIAAYYAAPDAASLEAKARAAFAAERAAPRALRGSAPDAQSYGRGAWFLKVRRAEAGASAFDAAVRRLVRARAGAAFSPEDLRAALEAETGRDFAAEFASVPLRAAHARVRLAFSWDAVARRATVTCVEAPPSDGGAPFAPAVPLAADDGVVRSAACGPERRETSWSAPRRPRWVSVDPEQTLFLEAERGWPADLLRAELSGAPPPASRVRAAWDLAAEPGAEAAAALRACARGDADPGVAAACAAALERRGPRRERP